jgi:hypothetical protein
MNRRKFFKSLTIAAPVIFIPKVIKPYWGKKRERVVVKTKDQLINNYSDIFDRTSEWENGYALQVFKDKKGQVGSIRKVVINNIEHTPTPDGFDKFVKEFHEYIIKSHSKVFGIPEKILRGDMPFNETYTSMRGEV